MNNLFQIYKVHTLQSKVYPTKHNAHQYKYKTTIRFNRVIIIFPKPPLFHPSQHKLIKKLNNIIAMTYLKKIKILINKTLLKISKVIQMRLIKK